MLIFATCLIIFIIPIIGYRYRSLDISNVVFTYAFNKAVKVTKDPLYYQTSAIVGNKITLGDGKTTTTQFQIDSTVPGSSQPNFGVLIKKTPLPAPTKCVMSDTISVNILKHKCSDGVITQLKGQSTGKVNFNNYCIGHDGRYYSLDASEYYMEANSDAKTCEGDYGVIIVGDTAGFSSKYKNRQISPFGITGAVATEPSFEKSDTWLIQRINPGDDASVIAPTDGSSGKKAKKGSYLAFVHNISHDLCLIPDFDVPFDINYVEYPDGGTGCKMLTFAGENQCNCFDSTPCHGSKLVSVENDSVAEECNMIMWPHRGNGHIAKFGGFPVKMVSRNKLNNWGFVWYAMTSSYHCEKAAVTADVNLFVNDNKIFVDKTKPCVIDMKATYPAYGMTDKYYQDLSKKDPNVAKDWLPSIHYQSVDEMFQSPNCIVFSGFDPLPAIEEISSNASKWLKMPDLEKAGQFIDVDTSIPEIQGMIFLRYISERTKRYRMSSESTTDHLGWFTIQIVTNTSQDAIVRTIYVESSYFPSALKAHLKYASVMSCLSARLGTMVSDIYGFNNFLKQQACIGAGYSDLSCYSF